MIQITLQTDTVSNISCGTSGGVNIYFDKIEVVNRLDRDHVSRTVKDYGVHYDQVWIFDKIHHEINQFCSSHTLHEVYIQLFDKLDESLAQALQRDCDKYDTGISIIAIRVTKPKIPKTILKEFESVEERKAKLLVLEQEHAAARKAAETKSIQAQMEAEKSATVAKIEAERDATISRILQEQKTGEVEAEAERTALVSRIHQLQLTAETQQQAERERVQNQVVIEIARNKTALWFEKASREVEIQKTKLTPQYIEAKLYEETGKALGENSKIYFGDKIPTMLMSPFAQDLRQLVKSDEPMSQPENNNK